MKNLVKRRTWNLQALKVNLQSTSYYRGTGRTAMKLLDAHIRSWFVNNHFGFREQNLIWLEGNRLTLDVKIE